ncbi:hypothetical protein AVEN_139722-1 [Araneus ventricosus]|uniref:Uncharacterized protein n=1 Tax=Araneus ventricosus TaxID=182803 RepID=A0A4Y2IKH2_ARAVE|nr:hypothetical protein AVEN_139722-1 [Araneus ventricosus]
MTSLPHDNHFSFVDDSDHSFTRNRNHDSLSAFLTTTGLPEERQRLSIHSEEVSVTEQPMRHSVTVRNPPVQQLPLQAPSRVLKKYLAHK